MTADLDALDKLEREATPLIVEGSDGKEWSITGPTCRIMPVNMWAGTVNKFAFVKRHLDDCKEIQGCSEETGHVYDVVAVFPTIEAAREYVALRAEILELREWKRQQMEVESTWDAQAVGEAIGAPLGASIRKAILPAIVAITKDRDELREKVERFGGLLDEHRESNEAVINNQGKRLLQMKAQSRADDIMRRAEIAKLSTDRDELREWVAKQRCQDCASVWGQDCLPTACNCENSRQGDGGPLCPPCRERARKEGK